MKDIILARPIVCNISATAHMTEEQAKNTRKLQAGALLADKHGNLISPKAPEAKDALFGSEAVLAYMKKLGLSVKPMRRIPVDAILTLCHTFDDAYDMLYLMQEVKFKNDRVKRLDDLKAPAVIMRNEYRQLYEAVERLFFNRFLPWRATYTCKEDDGSQVTHTRICVTDLLIQEELMQ